MVVLNVSNGKIANGFEEFCEKVSNDVYMMSMITALARVSKNYITNDTSYQLERTYVCEFYHQWSMLLNEKDCNPNNLCLNAEPCKHISQKAEWKYPDLILHHSQVDNGDNRIACEVKRKGWKKSCLNKDMCSLNLMLTGASEDGKLTSNFQWGVFIQIGGSVDKIEDYVKHQHFNDNILCIVVNDDVTQLTIGSVEELKKVENK
ncbi:MAG: hypothetical protein IJX41_06920 [Bacteroidaceae bacterium]|nr:hypothetical protein [Bacteroidaceae bacterium]